MSNVMLECGNFRFQNVRAQSAQKHVPVYKEVVAFNQRPLSCQPLISHTSVSKVIRSDILFPSSK